MAKATKKLKAYETTCDPNFNYSKLGVIRKRIDELIEEYGADAEYEIELDYGYGNSTPQIREILTIRRLETDEEFEKRIAEELQRLEETKNRELEQLRKLKKKYPSGLNPFKKKS